MAHATDTPPAALEVKPTDECRPVLLTTDGVLTGALRVDGDLRFAGRLEGDLEAAGAVELTATGAISGSVRCRTLSVAGSIDGDVTVEGPVIIAPTAAIRGTLQAGCVRFMDRTDPPGDDDEHVAHSTDPSRTDRATSVVPTNRDHADPAARGEAESRLAARMAAITRDRQTARTSPARSP